MSTTASTIVVYLIALAILVPLAMLGYRQAKRAAAASDGDVGTTFLSGVAFLFAFIASPLGILFAHLSLRQIAHTGASGVRLSVAALCIAYALTVLQLTLLLWGSFTGYFH
ncbi:hypothetical protein [Subtercola lobariae]|uniref:DUF4190 domain-containing protein n=1 Tax=Subtercola lobariae TaxID=1588641 RepID=A0A917EUR1_9MICO|nr:hypothetical protein [Subtercola lobariae]GGF14733.1 hypothetical protein GCM10011399_05750 [Subtercola lobariae]